MGGYADPAKQASTVDAEPASQSIRPASMKMSSGDYVELASALLMNATYEADDTSADMKPGPLEARTHSTLSRCNIAVIELQALRYRGDKSTLLPVVTSAARRLEVLKTILRSSAAPAVYSLTTAVTLAQLALMNLAGLDSTLHGKTAAVGHSDSTTKQGRTHATFIRKYRATPRAIPLDYVAIDIEASRAKPMQSFVTLDTMDGGLDFSQVEVEAAGGVDIGSSDD